MIKILVKSPIPWDSTSFYRTWGVLHNLNRKFDRRLDLQPFQGRNFTWAELGAYDILYMQRPAKTDDLKLAQYCKDLGIKVWIDYDDNLFCLPNESRAFFDYDVVVKKTMQDLLLLADCVSVSTVDLKIFFESLGAVNVDVVPNAVNEDFIKPASAYNADSKVIVWRGSETHCGDLTYFSDYLYDAIKDSEYHWHFMGYNPFTLTNSDISGKIFLHKGEDVMIYNQRLKLLKPKVMHVPLVDNELNRAKSNIAWIEATYAGAVTIAPNWPEWNRPGVICYDDMDDYKKLLTIPSQDYAKCWEASMKYIKENLTLDYVNQKRIDIITKLL